MFCRFGSALDSRPVAATIWLKRRVDAAAGVGQRDQPVDGLAQLRAVAPGQQLLEQRVRGLREQLLQRLGVGGVAGLDLLGLGQVALAEQDLLQLLRRAEVERPADELRAPPPRRGACRRRTRRRAPRRPVRSTAIPACSISASRRTSGSSTSAAGARTPCARRGGARARRASAGSTAACPGQVLGRLARCRTASWSPPVADLDADAQDALGDVGQAVAALARARPGRPRGRCRCARRRGPARRDQRQRRALGVVQVLGRSGVGQPVEHGVGGRPGPSSRGSRRPAAIVERPRRRRSRPRPRPHVPGDGADRGAADCARPATRRPPSPTSSDDLGAASVAQRPRSASASSADGRANLVEPLAQGAELQRVEQPVDLVAVPRLRGRRRRGRARTGRRRPAG